MNKKKKNQILRLSAVLILLIAAFTALKLSGGGLDGEEEAKAVSYEALNIDTDQVTQIGIIAGDSTVNLERNGDVWKCTDQEKSDIDSSAVELFLTGAGAVSSDIMIENAEDMSQYGLEDPALNITLQWDSNMYTLKVGDYNSVIGSYYLSINDEKTVYAISSAQYSQLNKTLEDFQLTEAPEAEAPETAE